MEDPDMDMMEQQECEILDPHTPTIYISGEINKDMAKKFRVAVRELEFLRKSDIALVVIDSIGGMVMSSFEILNIMKSSKIEFMTYNVSHAFSAAAVILSAGAEGKRFMAPLSNAMVHNLSAGAAGSIEEIRVEVKFLERMNAMLTAELAKNCKKTPEEIQKAIAATGSTDLHLDPYEAKAFGLVDEVAYVSLIQARAYQLEVITEDAEEEVEPEPEIQSEKPKKTPAKKKTSTRRPTKKTTPRKTSKK